MITFSDAVNQTYRNYGMVYITIDQAIDFIVQVRGQSWINAGIGIASCHQQWDELLVRIFEFANADAATAHGEIKKYLSNDE